MGSYHPVAGSSELGTAFSGFMKAKIVCRAERQITSRNTSALWI